MEWSPRYGFYGHPKKPNNLYDEVQELYNGWDYTEKVHEAIEREVKATRADVALFDQSSFGKVHSFFVIWWSTS